MKMRVPMNLQKSFQRFSSLVTVEPCIAVFFIASSLTTIANQNLLLDKTCRVNLDYDQDLCDRVVDRDVTVKRYSVQCVWGSD